ncbi:hypothetical protein [Sinomonas terrae]|uniref:Uncharacterized protein n=1 Tax=Sinomonas terrae TaxID=2908838 RepID=A0ABS9U389_9MICC|nr:hypothetical protein [Sinomonas terrae]MCH6471159.1 hypothetical protein [Sinomonas terrae]
METAAAADRRGTCVRVLEHLVATQRSLEATLGPLAAAHRPPSGSGPDGDPRGGAQTASELEDAGMTADLLLEKLARVLNALP